MGLDQYIYRVKKPNIQDKVYTSDELRRMDLSKISVEDFKNNPVLYEDLRPYVVKRDVECKFYDLKKIVSDYGLPQNSSIWMYSMKGIEISGTTKNGERVNKAISTEEIEAKYVKTEILPYYIWEEEEVEYWRKHYDLQEWIYNNIYEVENTAYCILSTDLIKQLNKRFNEDIPVEEPTEESALFYWEWY